MLNFKSSLTNIVFNLQFLLLISHYSLHIKNYGQCKHIYYLFCTLQHEFIFSGI